jgi:predicted DNA-binding transcriptional regulator AlpA
VGALLGLPTATLANWRCAGTGPPFLRVGRHVRYRRGDVDTWINAQIRDPEVLARQR